MQELLVFLGFALVCLFFIIALAYGDEIQTKIDSKIEKKKKAIKNPYIKAYFELMGDQDWVSWAEKDRMKALKQAAKEKQESIPDEFRLYSLDEHEKIQENLKKPDDDK